MIVQCGWLVPRRLRPSVLPALKITCWRHGPGSIFVARLMADSLRVPSHTYTNLHIALLKVERAKLPAPRCESMQ